MPHHQVDGACYLSPPVAAWRGAAIPSHQDMSATNGPCQVPPPLQAEGWRAATLPRHQAPPFRGMEQMSPGPNFRAGSPQPQAGQLHGVPSLGAGFGAAMTQQQHPDHRPGMTPQQYQACQFDHFRPGSSVSDYRSEVQTPAQVPRSAERNCLVPPTLQAEGWKAATLPRHQASSAGDSQHFVPPSLQSDGWRAVALPSHQADPQQGQSFSRTTPPKIHRAALGGRNF